MLRAALGIIAVILLAFNATSPAWALAVADHAAIIVEIPASVDPEGEDAAAPTDAAKPKSCLENCPLLPSVDALAAGPGSDRCVHASATRLSAWGPDVFVPPPEAV